MTEKLILTDVDGCLLWWEEGFHGWMKASGHNRIKCNSYALELHYPGMSSDEAYNNIVEYNNSSWMLGIPPYKDSRIGVARLADAGHTFHAITSMSKDPFSKELRRMNLDNLFGKDVITQLTCLDLDQSKRNSLEPYRDSGMVWIEDHPKNAMLGAEMGLDVILFDHSYNQEVDDERVKRVNSWSEVCDYLLDAN